MVACHPSAAMIFLRSARSLGVIPAGCMTAFHPSTPCTPFPRAWGAAAALRALAAARGREQRQRYRSAGSAGGAISRFWILPVGPLGSASAIQTWRGYLYAATWPLT